MSTASCRALVLCCVIAGLTSCDPVAGVTVRTVVRPTPNSDCLAKALANSPRVATVHQTTDRLGAGFDVALLDTIPIEAIDPEIRVRLQSGPADTTQLMVSFRLEGRPTWAVDKADSRRLDSIGTALARNVIKSCAPGSPEKLSCRVSGFFWTKSCG